MNPHYSAARSAEAFACEALGEPMSGGECVLGFVAVEAALAWAARRAFAGTASGPRCSGGTAPSAASPGKTPASSPRARSRQPSRQPSHGRDSDAALDVATLRLPPVVVGMRRSSPVAIIHAGSPCLATSRCIGLANPSSVRCARRWRLSASSSATAVFAATDIPCPYTGLNAHALSRRR